MQSSLDRPEVDGQLAHSLLKTGGSCPPPPARSLIESNRPRPNLQPRRAYLALRLTAGKHSCH